MEKSKDTYFKNKKVVIATMHEKEKVIGKLFKERFGIETSVPGNFNTDIFGTFTRDVKRSGDQLEAARKKALSALETTGADIAIASEGSFSPHPNFPHSISNLELVLLLDIKNNIEVRGHARTTNTNYAHKKVSSLEEVISFAKETGFPEHGIIVRRSDSSRKIYKDIQTWEDLEALSKKLFVPFFKKTLFLETDMRAHRNPSRMKVIEQATIDLIKNINTTCSDCGTVGFSKIQFLKGLPCSSCGLETDVPGVFLYQCQNCKKEEERKEGDFAQPKECAFCNP
jgi:hypothetical protein